MSAFSNNRSAPWLALCFALGLGLAACGGEAYREGSTDPGVLPGPQNPGSFGGSVGGGFGGFGGGVGGSVGTTTQPVLTYSFTITGDGGNQPTYTTPAIPTDSKLRVKIKSGPASRLNIAGGSSQYSNFSAVYGCISYTVTVLGQSVATDVLKVSSGGYLCPQAPDNQVIDFSSRLTPGHGPVTIQVSQPLYDFYCQLYWSGYTYATAPGASYCPVHTVYRNHTVTGSLQVEVNGSSFQ